MPAAIVIKELLLKARIAMASTMCSECQVSGCPSGQTCCRPLLSDAIKEIDLLLKMPMKDAPIEKPNKEAVVSYELYQLANQYALITYQELLRNALENLKEGETFLDILKRASGIATLCNQMGAAQAEFRLPAIESLFPSSSTPPER